ncbi:embryonic protein UVS.2-like [Pelodytes ibericus]
MGISILLLVCMIGPVMNVPVPPSLQGKKKTTNSFGLILFQMVIPGLKEFDDIEKSEKLETFSNIIQSNQDSEKMIVEGDILLNPAGRSALNCANCLWPKSENGTVIVPYNLSSSYNRDQLNLFNNAMQEYETLTCIRFVNRTTQKDFLKIDHTGGCLSYIGKMGGGQAVNLGATVCMARGIIQHELNHNLGFVHEQSRSDRDNYVDIMYQYIPQDYASNFNQLNTNNLGLEYDYGSVMHYDRYAFSNTSGQATIIPKPDPTVPLGQTDGLSPLDVSKINKLYQCDVCATLLNTMNGAVTSANYPSPYPNNSSCVWLIRVPRGVVSLKFNAFDVQSSPGCISDYIKIYDGHSKTSPVLVDRTCGTGLIPLMISSTNQMLIEFGSDGTVNGVGFKATYTSVQCGGAFYSPTRNVTSPGYPNKYPASMDCQYTITAPAGYKVSLTIQDFSIEAPTSYACKNDYLSIYSGSDTSAPLMGTFCGYMDVTTFTSTGNTMLLTFHSDRFLQFRGFWASFKFLRVSLQFNALDVQSSPGCISDYIKIYDGHSDTNAPLMGTLCGLKNVLSFASTGNTMMLTFHSDHFYQCREFKVYQSSNDSNVIRAIVISLLIKTPPNAFFMKVT